MKINKENIEEVIFDFHEGNLSDVEKGDLMAYLHQHPEYEKEFVLWAKTYHTDKLLIDYQNDDRFFKKQYPSLYKWGAVAVAGSLIVAWIYLWPLESQKEAIMEDTKESPVLADSISILPSIIESKELKAAPSAAKKEKVEISQVDATPFVAVKDSIGSSPVPEESSVMPDTAIVPITKEQLPKREEEAVTKKKEQVEQQGTALKKPKKKRKLNLTPSDDILPFNTDL